MSDTTNRRIYRVKHSFRWLVTAVVIVTLVSQPLLVVGVQPVAAQDSENGNDGGNGNNGGNGNGGGTSADGFASQVCTSDGYNLVLGLIYVVVGLAILGLIAGGLVGTSMLSFSWIGRTLGSVANRMITGSIAGGILMLLIITILGIVMTNVSIGIPQACTGVLN